MNFGIATFYDWHFKQFFVDHELVYKFVNLLQEYKNLTVLTCKTICLLFSSQDTEDEEM